MEESFGTNSVIPSLYSMLAQFDNHRGAGCSVITEDWQWNRQSTLIFYLLLYYYIVHNLKRSEMIISEKFIPLIDSRRFSIVHCH